MPVRKKRIPTPQSVHIAVQSQVSSLEDDRPVVEATPPKAEESETTLETLLAQDALEPELTKKNMWMYRFGIIATGIIVTTAVVTYLLYLRQSSAPISSVTPTSTPTPVPTIVIDTKTITVEVFNASGVAGRASKMADMLKEKGYTVLSTGNAKKTPGTVISFSSALSEKAKELVLSDLLSMGVSSVSSTIVDSSISARITLGLK